MFSSVSHEFRTPMNAFSNALNLLKFTFTKIDKIVKSQISGEKISEEYFKMFENTLKYIKIGEISSKTLMTLIDDILDFAKLESGTFSVNETTFCVKNLIDEMYDMFTFQCKQKNLRLEIN